MCFENCFEIKSSANVVDLLNPVSKSYGVDCENSIRVDFVVNPLPSYDIDDETIVCLNPLPDNPIEIGTSNSFETLRAHALRTAFCEWALAVDHVNALACDAHDSDSSDEVFPDAQGSTTMGNPPLALSPALTLNRLPDHANARCLCPCGCRRRPGACDAALEGARVGLSLIHI